MMGKLSFKKIIFYLMLVIIPLIAIELGLRIFFAVKVSPNVLLFGTPWFNTKWQQKFDDRGYSLRRAKNEKANVMWHDNYLNNYSKYYPREERTDHDENGKKFVIKMNNLGFRGPDFTYKKEAGTIRIIILGASSTFGYRDRDNETYPYYLQEFLNQKLGEERCGEIKHFEVLNLGIPHLRAENIYFLFMKEVLKLNPDVVTFYEGSNDVDLDQRSITKKMMRNRYLSFVPAIYHELRQRLIFLAAVAEFVNTNLIKYKSSDLIDDHYNAKNRPTGKADKQIASVADVDNKIYQQNKAMFASFLNYLEMIRNECRGRHILFIVANQQGSSYSFPREKLKGMSYEQEVIFIKKRLINHDNITRHQLYLLGHAALNKRIKGWASENQVIFVDVINALDQDRDTILSWVHLSPRGNRIIAREFANTIFNRLCRENPKQAEAK